MADTLSVYENNLALLTICASVFFVISLPIYSIGIYKFWNKRHHHFIRRRFPVISMSIIVASFVTATINTTIRWTHYITSNHKSPEISSGCTYLVYGLINIRLTLIYLRWKYNANTYMLNQQFLAQSNEELSMSSVYSTSETNINDNEQIAMHTTGKIYYHWSCLILLFVTMVAATLIAFVNPETTLYTMVIGIGWFIQIIVTIILVLIILCKKVSEGIGCIKETVIMLSFQLIIIFMIPLMFVSKQMVLPMMIIFNLGTYIQGLIPLCVPLYYVNKITETNSNDVNVNTDCPLFEFLNKYENYQLFKKYLSHCWALESLLFFERVSVIYSIVLGLKKNSNMNNDEIITEAEIDIIHHNKFEYLKAIYGEYNKCIFNDAKQTKEVEFTLVRNNIFKVFQQIYTEFISDDALNQVNISSAVKKNLAYLLQNDQQIEKFVSFDDFLILFDESIRELYQLMVSMYNYEFKRFTSV